MPNSGDSADGSLTIRQYDPADEAAVWRLHELAFEDLATDPDDIPGTEDLRAIERTYLDAGGDFLVGTLPQSAPSGQAPAVEDGTLVAMGGFLPAEAGHEDERTVPGGAELHRMRVAPSYQRRGYGRRLLKALERRARSAGYEIILATTARRQQAAVNFYAAEGYRRVGTSTTGEYELVHFEKQVAQDTESTG